MNKNKILPISLFTLFLIGTISILPNADAVERYTGTDASKIEMECREGQVLIFKFTANNQLCTSASTAEMWERMGVGQIVRSPIDGNSMEQSTPSTESTIGIPNNTEHHEVMSPYHQIRMGVAAEDVICKSDLSLMIRQHGVPACVQKDSVQKMSETMAWGFVAPKMDKMQDDESSTGNDISVELEESVGLKSK